MSEGGRASPGSPLVILAGGCWEERWTTFQRVARELGRYRRVLYVEGNYSAGKLVRSCAGDGPRSWLRPGWLRPVGERLHVLTPPCRLPLRNHFEVVGRLQQAMLVHSVRRAVETLGFRGPVLWTFLHQSHRIVGELGERLSVYHCVDDWPWLISRLPLLGRRSRIATDEVATARAVDFVVATSRFLADRLRRENPASYHVPNAADPVPTRDRVCPADLFAIPRPRIGFSGTLEAKTDLDLLRRIAIERPDWRLVFVGHAENVPDIDRICALPNVHFLGLKPRAVLPDYLEHFDVCLVPFRRFPEIESISPLKVFEYLASGSPVVATRYGEMEGFEGLIYLAEEPGEFLAQISRAMREDSASRRAARRDFAEQNTWERRGQTLLELLRRHEAAGPA